MPEQGNSGNSSNTPSNTSNASSNTNNSPSNTNNSPSNTSNSISGQNLTGTLADLSGFQVPPIVNFTLNETLDASGTRVVNQQGTSADGTGVTHTTFETLPSFVEDVDISANLVGVVQNYYNSDVDINSPTNIVLQQIKTYAAEIQCSDFQGKGTIDDYTQLFQAASKIANDANQIRLDVDLSGFNDFGQAADDLSKLFNSFTVKLQNVSIIDDLAFLQGIASALAKIVNLSNVFGKFKETILMTSSVQVPKSSHDATALVNDVMGEINCAMGYIQNFVAPGLSPAPINSQLSVNEKNIIGKAVSTIDNWSVLSSQGVTIAMANNPDIVSMTNASKILKSTTLTLKSYTNVLKAKMAQYNITST